MLLRYGLPLLAIVGVILAIRVVRAGESDPPPAAPVAAPASPPFPSFVAGSGIVEASSRNIAIGTPLSGTVEELLVEVGDRVSVGDPLFRLDTREARAHVEVAAAVVATREAELARLRGLPRPEDVAPLRARVETAQAELADAAARLRMWESVEDPRAVPRDELDRRRFAVQVAEGRLADAKASLAAVEAGAWEPEIAIAEAQASEARADLDRARTQLDRLTVRAPVECQILQVNVRAGEFALAGALATPLMLVGTVDPLHVRVDVDENDAWRVRRGTPAVAFVRGNSSLRTDLRFVRFEPFVVPKRSLTGDSTERVDTRVLQVIYAFDPATLNVFVGQQVDVFIEAPSLAASGGIAAATTAGQSTETSR